jgi:hypothetical protein
MPLKRLQYKPGVNVELSPSANPQGWSQSNAIRWRFGQPEALLGFEEVSSQPVNGVARAMHYWADLTGIGRFAIGTNTALYFELAGALTNITPTEFVPGPVSSPNVPFSLLVWSLDNFGQDLVACPSGQGIFLWVPPGGLATQITEAPAANNGLVVLDQVQIIFAWGCTAVDVVGTIAAGQAAVITTISSGTYNSGTGAVSLTTAGAHGLTPGSPFALSAITGTGSFIDLEGEWTATTGTTGTTLNFTAPTGLALTVIGGNVLSPGNFYDNTTGFVSLQTEAAHGLVAGDVFVLTSLVGTGSYTDLDGQWTATAGTTGTTLNFIGPAGLTLAVTGGTLSSVGSDNDPMLTRWCDQSDFTDWIASTTNQAGSFRIPHGSRIIGCLRVPGMLLLWTDIDLWAVQYIGFPLVFSFQNAGQLCSLIAQKAACALGQVVYWMSDHGFFSLTGGGPQQLVCPVWDIVYKNLAQGYTDKIVCGANFHYSEVWWFYPSITGGTNEIDSYVKLNVQEGEWDYGPAIPGIPEGTPNVFSRTAWTDSNQPGQPVSIDLSGLMQQIDMGFTQNGGNAIPALVRSGYADITDGDQLMSVDQFIPDFLWNAPEGVTPTLNITLYFRAFPGDTPVTMGPFQIEPTTEYVTLRTEQTINIGGTVIAAAPAVRAREVAIQIDSGQLPADAATWWRMGACRIRARPVGRIP